MIADSVQGGISGSISRIFIIGCMYVISLEFFC